MPNTLLDPELRRDLGLAAPPAPTMGLLECSHTMAIQDMSGQTDTGRVRAGIASAACFGFAFLLLGVLGAGDWSDWFTTLWYGLFVAALVLALVAIFELARPTVPLWRRLVGAALGAMTLAVAAWFVWSLLSLIDEIN